MMGEQGGLGIHLDTLLGLATCDTMPVSVQPSRRPGRF